MEFQKNIYPLAGFKKEPIHHSNHKYPQIKVFAIALFLLQNFAWKFLSFYAEEQYFAMQNCNQTF